MEDPSLMTHEAAIRYFLDEVGPSLAAAGTVERVIRRFAAFYTTTRIVGADENDWDEFCLEIGCYQKIYFPEPGDYRGRGNDAQVDGESKYLQVSLRRAVHPCGVMEGVSEYDDGAFEMSVVLYFKPMNDRSLYIMVECSDGETLEKELSVAMTQPALRYLRERPITSIYYYVGGAG